MYKLPSLQELLEAGVHFGHQVRRGHPRMRPYIYGEKDGVAVIDLTKSDELLKEACEFVYNLGKEGKVLLFVGTKKQARPIIEKLAKELKAPYLIERWMGGFLTNHEEIKKNIKLLKDYKAQKEKGVLAKYTKKEQLLLDRKMSKLQKDFAGVEEFDELPDAIFVTDAVAENIAVREANRLNIPVVAIADSNSDPTQIDYPIPGNDDAIKSITILVTSVAGAYGEGVKEAGKAALKQKEKEEKAKKAEVAKETDLLAGRQDLAAEVAEAEEKVEKETVKEFERKIE